MRIITALIALSIAPLAAAQQTPCQDASTYSIRRCASALTESVETAAASRETLADLAWCSETKKKRELLQCVSEMRVAARRLGRATRILAAASESGVTVSGN